MDIYEALASQAVPIAIEPGETSYFAPSAPGLDPRLFRGSKLIPQVRSSILRILFDHASRHYRSADTYLNVWLAGSAVSYQWTAARNPADLDCLIGINYLKFRQANPEYKALSDKQIAQMFNQDFRELSKSTEEFMGNFELTFYANVNANILDIKPYAAYSLTLDDWTVKPEVKGQPKNKTADLKASRDTAMANDIISRYSKALSDIHAATTDVAKRNAEAALKLAVDQGASLFDDIHSGRKSAFSQYGQGYSDIHNYRWQAGKASGAVQALKKMKEIKEQGKSTFETNVYGMELPTTDVLIRRAIGGR